MAEMLILSQDSEDEFDQDLCLNFDMTSSSYFDKMNSTLGSVVPLAMFLELDIDINYITLTLMP